MWKLKFWRIKQQHPSGVGIPHQCRLDEYKSWQDPSNWGKQAPELRVRQWEFSACSSALLNQGAVGLRASADLNCYGTTYTEMLYVGKGKNQMRLDETEQEGEISHWIIMKYFLTVRGLWGRGGKGTLLHRTFKQELDKALESWLWWTALFSKKLQDVTQ